MVELAADLAVAVRLETMADAGFPALVN